MKYAPGSRLTGIVADHWRVFNKIPFAQYPFATVPFINPTSLILNQETLALLTLVHDEPPQAARYTVTGPGKCVHCDQ